MPIEFSTGLDCDLVYARWYGAVNFAQFEKNFALYLSDTNYRPGRRELIDLSRVAQFDISSAMIRTMLRDVNAQSPDIIVETHTVIYSPNETIFGMGRMYQQLAELGNGIRVEVFQQEADALAALGLPHPDIASLLAAEVFVPPQPREG